MTATLSRPPASGVYARVSGSRRAKNLTATVFVTLSFLIALVPLFWLLWTVVSKGLHVILKSAWWTSTQRNVTLTDSSGGALHAIVGTLEQVALCSLISVPVAILVGVYLVEYGRGPFARITTFMVDIMTGIPSIVASLFIYALFISTFGGDRSGYLISLALVILMVPVIIRTTEEMLKLVPDELREASYALGIPKWKTIVKVVLPTAFTGLVTGVVLGIARVAGETAPLLILVGYAGGMNANLFASGKFQGSLPGMINDQFANLNQATGGTAYHLDANGNRVMGASHNFAPDRMWGAALTLILLVLLLNVIARWIGRFNKVAK
ncbi:MAG: phosphate ABC transporter permease PstA [Jatrophihabitans sp.]